MSLSSSTFAWLALGLALLMPARAATPADPPALETVRLMEVRGKVVIGVDGAVVAAEVQTERVTGPLRDALLAKARGWRFKPVLVKGQPVQAQANFRMVLAATQQGETFDVRVDGLEFGGGNEPGAIVPDGAFPEITGKTMTPPRYPQDLQMRERTGGVLLAILVSPDGRAERVQVVQSLAHDFTGHLPDKSARATMRAIEGNAIAAARHWTFNVPPELVHAEPAQRTVMVPVVYVIRYDVSQPGYWIPVHRGPVRPAEWLPPERSEGLAFGGSGGGQMSALDSPYKMLQAQAGTTLH